MPWKLLATIASSVFAMVVALAPAARAEVSTVRLAQQYGIAYLPLTVMKSEGLFEKHAKDLGLTLKTEWLRFAAGSGMNDGLLSGNLDFASGGVSPLITIWGKTEKNLNVRAVAALNETPLYIVTANPKVKSITDFTSNDRIAMPTIKTSFQALILQMALRKVLGPGQENKLDPITVAMSHPDAMTALLGGRSEVNSHFTSPPFYSQEVADPRIHTVLNSFDVFGGPHTFTIVWATSKFADANPTVMKAFYAALEDAMQRIAKDPADAARIYIKAEGSKYSEAEVVKLITEPGTKFSATPKKVFTLYEYMHQIGLVTRKASSWKDLFFPGVHSAQGS